jgi:hypothetical protein
LSVALYLSIFFYFWEYYRKPEDVAQ